MTACGVGSGRNCSSNFIKIFTSKTGGLHEYPRTFLIISRLIFLRMEIFSDKSNKINSANVVLEATGSFVTSVRHMRRHAPVPSWSCSQAVTKSVRHTPLLCVQWKTLDDGQTNRPKHVEFYSKNKFDKLMQLVGFIIRMNVIHYEHSLQQTCNINTLILGILKLLNNILFLLPFQRCRLERSTYKDIRGSLNRLIDFGVHFHTSIIWLFKYRLRPAVVMSVQLNARVRLNIFMTWTGATRATVLV